MEFAFLSVFLFISISRAANDALSYLDTFDYEPDLSIWRSAIRGSTNGLNFYRNITDSTCFVPSNAAQSPIFVRPNGYLTADDEYGAINDLILYSCIPGTHIFGNDTVPSFFWHTYLTSPNATNITGGAIIESEIVYSEAYIVSGLSRSSILRTFGATEQPIPDDLHSGVRQFSKITRPNIVVSGNNLLHIIDAPITPVLSLEATGVILGLNSMSSALTTDLPGVESVGATHDRSLVVLSDAAFARYQALSANFSSEEYNQISAQNSFDAPVLTSFNFTTAGGSTRTARSGDIVNLSRQYVASGFSNNLTYYYMNEVRVIEADIPWTGGSLWVTDGHIFLLPDGSADYNISLLEKVSGIGAGNSTASSRATSTTTSSGKPATLTTIFTNSSTSSSQAPKSRTSGADPVDTSLP